ncbi:MAG TPA: M2 family metallopeptidase, partial [Anaeromyxobacteraceae bacterium]
EAMLALGASRPWPDAMEALTGQREADASAVLDYFAPLQRWLKQQNAGRRCGW